MGQIKDTISVYERLREKRYRIKVENGFEFILEFDKKYYHHLAGYHYLTDVLEIADPVQGKERFYRRLKNGKIAEDKILHSELFESIAERIETFAYIEEILSEAECKIIVEFDRNKADSEIEAKFFLYKRNGNPLAKEPVVYYMLFIGCDPKAGTYYPATYIVEHSKKYVADQVMLECKIEWIA